MTDFEPSLPDYAALVDACDRVTHLPQSQAFEQVMYDNLSTRVVRYLADRPITFHPLLLRTQFPENLRDCFISSNELTLERFRIVQLLQQEDETGVRRRSKLAFTTNGFDYTFTTDGTDAVMSVETANGPSELRLSDQDYTAFVASIVYALQFSPDSTEIKLVDDPLQVRAETSSATESLMERMIMTLGEFDGQAETITTTIFDTGTDVIEAELKVHENPRMSGVNNSMKLSRIIGASSLDDSVNQNEAFLNPNRLTNHYAESIERDLLQGQESVRIIEPQDDFEGYAKICMSFTQHIQPLMAPYELADGAS